jgi:hypothetical protein
MKMNRHSCKGCSSFSLAQNKEPFGNKGGVTFVCPVTKELLFSEFIRVCEKFTPADSELSDDGQVL